VGRTGEVRGGENDDIGETQGWNRSTATGTLDGARGSVKLVNSGVTLAGQRDIFGRTVDLARWKAGAGSSNWSGGNWNGSRWTGDGWSGSRWTAATWTGSSWSGSAWTSVNWSGSRWTGDTWSSAGWGD
jgi:serine protease AprX